MISRCWWERPWLLLAIALFASLPLIWPHTPPLVDVPGHIGRYRVELDLLHSPSLQKYFEFKWSFIGNLGVDLLIVPMSALFGIETGTKLIILTIPVLTTLGVFLTAREIHGRVPATAFFAVPFAYGYPFNFGFINFSLSMAFALLSFALWLRLRPQPLWARALIFVPLSSLIWLTHAFGWGALGLLVWSAELIAGHDSGKSWPASALLASGEAALLALPALFMIIWRSGDVSGTTYGYLGIGSKIFSIAAAMRDRWLLWDAFSVAAVIVVIGAGVFDDKLELSRKLMIPAATLFVAYLVIPTQLFGSAYADMRLAPYMLMLAVLAVRFRDSTKAHGAGLIAGLGLSFIALRVLGNTASFVIYDRDMSRYLGALAYIPRGAPVLSVVGNDCGASWPMPVHSHLGSFVITRREGFSNDQWQLPGAQLLRVKYYAAGAFAADPSETVFTKACLVKTAAKLKQGQHLSRSIDQALGQFPRQAFQYVWLIKPVDWDGRPRAGLVPVWTTKDSALYRVVGQKTNRWAPDPQYRP